ncbi:YhdH/YhfP family quinone oxidoreductase [Spirochaeta isovalerica]|uniref:Putative YhdH/YhfP family quinone oxidoreductase n=1 Tax=Spirochaeta isovalerica TaxID=150 RepID=A0A841R8Z5_9SPIO|nr:YhdH/YhfP family quinone oxidoreductase [Spirochaeta isovalerica]MBB6480266.1 putative YhdH/YhfP family quinone oxidoreductase [Spirochaeta isovalerica]
MKDIDFKAYVVNEEENNYLGKITRRKIDDLPEGDLLIKVYYSSLNYKDALSASGNKGVTKSYPHTPGIDAVGEIVRSEDQRFTIGDKVIVTSYDLGMNTDGGFGEYIQVPSKWAVKLPENLSMKEAMIYGTAGLTAGISILRLTELVKPEDGKIIVSGATGGVGTISVAILKKLGYSVTAITGKETEKKYLSDLGAEEIIMRKDFEALEKKPLLKTIYAGAIDTVGGIILENIIKSIKQNGAVTCCGNVASAKLELTVFPFILRGVTLIGIDSQNLPMIYREKVWKQLASDWKPDSLMDSYDEISLDDIDQKISLMLQGKLKGRTVINMSK